MDIKSKAIEMVDIDSIIENPKNANQHSEEQIERLCKLIKHNGFRNPLIISKRTGFLVSGHGRLMAARKLGMTELPVVKQEFESEAQEYSYLISDNEIARWATLDKDLVLDEIEDLDMDIELLGLKDFNLFDMGEIEPEKEEIEKSREFILEVKFPNDMEMHDVKDELLSKGYLVKEKGE